MNRQALLFLTASLIAFVGCDSVEDQAPSPATSGVVAAGSLPGASLGTVSDVVTLGDYTVEFLSADPVGGATEFKYRVTRVSSSGSSFNYFFLENACGADPAALSPTGSVTQGTNTDSDEDIYGVQWNPSLTEGSRLYSYAFTGAQLGVVRTVIRAGGVTEVATLPGPCGGLATLSGSVFVNTDADTGRSGTELGIGDVRVDVYDGAEIAASGVTSSNGGFSFTLPRSEYTSTGAYTVRVPTSGTDVFNDGLYGSYYYTGGGVAERSVPLNADVSGVDFGFNPDKQKIIVDLSEGGAFQTRAQDVNFWQGVIRNAARGRCVSDPYGGDDICPGDVLADLNEILYAVGEVEGEYYLLADPFVMTGTDELAMAADLLSRPTQTDAAKVSRNLFAMQLNLLRGWGTGSQSYDDALMSYLEEWVRANSGSARAASAASATMSAAKAGGGGGGTIEELTITAKYLGGGGGGTIEDQ